MPTDDELTTGPDRSVEDRREPLEDGDAAFGQEPEPADDDVEAHGGWGTAH